MLQAGDRLRFDAEALKFFTLHMEAWMDHLDGDEPVQAELPRLDDHAHPPATELFEQFVARDLESKCRRPDHELGPGGSSSAASSGPARVLTASDELPVAPQIGQLRR